ncbi:MAG: hypothetical protein SFV24_20920 [Gemmatimonadales bacterium]|nr:hypothetical protein [Gemmatimonadales bacterium]
MAHDRDIPEPRVAGRQYWPFGDDVLYVGGDSLDRWPVDPPAPVVDVPGPSVMLVIGPGAWVHLVPPAQAAGVLHLWPGQRESLVRPLIQEAVDGLLDDYRQGVYRAYRYREVTGVGAERREQRGWWWAPAFGPGGYREWIDATPVRFGALREWPRTPEPRVHPPTARAA